MAAAAAKNAVFFEVRDASYPTAEKLVVQSSPAELSSCYEPMNQTMLFFAASRAFGQDAQALALCSTLLDRGIAVNHPDVHSQTALFYAAREGHVETVKFLIANGADPNLMDKNGNTAKFYAHRRNRQDVVNALMKEDNRKRRRSPDGGAEDDTPVKRLRAWANERPVRGRPIGNTFKYKAKDVIKAEKDFVVVGKAPPSIAARLRISERNFVTDHAVLLSHQPWFTGLSHQEWCSNVGVLPDKSGVDAVNAIKAVLAGDDPLHFTLPIVQVKTNKIAGYVHAARKPETSELNIAHLKVDETFRGQGLGGLLIEASEDFSKSMGWNCCTTTLSVLEVNAPARRCYWKAGFTVQSIAAAFWGSHRSTKGRAG